MKIGKFIILILSVALIDQLFLAVWGRQFLVFLLFSIVYLLRSENASQDFFRIAVSFIILDILFYSMPLTVFLIIFLIWLSVVFIKNFLSLEFKRGPYSLLLILFFVFEFWGLSFLAALF